MNENQVNLVKSVFFPYIDYRCPPVPLLINAQPLSRTSIEGNIVSYFCDVGHLYNGATTFNIMCDNGEWNESSIACSGNKLGVPVTRRNVLLNKNIMLYLTYMYMYTLKGT